MKRQSNFFFRAFKSYRELSPQGITTRLLGRYKNNRRMAILFFAFHPGPFENMESSLAAWLQSQGMDVSSKEIQALVHAYGNPRLNLADYGYLLGRHPLEVWCARELVREPAISWDDLWAHSRQARQVASSWLYQTRHRKAQDIRLRIRIEQDAFARMTPYWQRLGFPFEQLVPSYATAIGNSCDRPAALAELMGIIVNDGLRRPIIRFNQLRFAEDTPYHTVFEPSPRTSMRVMEASVAGVLKSLLADVVSKWNRTARGRGICFSGWKAHPDRWQNRLRRQSLQVFWTRRRCHLLASRQPHRHFCLLHWRPILWRAVGFCSWQRSRPLQIYQRLARGHSQAVSAGAKLPHLESVFQEDCPFGEATPIPSLFTEIDRSAVDQTVSPRSIAGS